MEPNDQIPSVTQQLEVKLYADSLREKCVIGKDLSNWEIYDIGQAAVAEFIEGVTKYPNEDIEIEMLRTLEENSFKQDVVIPYETTVGDNYQKSQVTVVKMKRAALACAQIAADRIKQGVLDFNRWVTNEGYQYSKIKSNGPTHVYEHNSLPDMEIGQLYNAYQFK